MPLTERGAEIQLLVGVNAREGAALQRSGLPVPQPVNLNGVVDTGTMYSLVDAHWLDQLAIAPVGEASVGVVGVRSPIACNQFEISLTIIHPALPRGQKRLFKSLPVLGADLKNATGDEALLGQDVLTRCRFVYDGRARTFSLDF